MKNHLYRLAKVSIYVVLLMQVPCPVYAENHIVKQQNKKFDTDKLVVKKGDTVEFLNLDRFFHNIYSISKAQSFDLGSYPKGQSKSIKFNQAGTIEVRCAIHPNMKMTVDVQN